MSDIPAQRRQDVYSITGGHCLYCAQKITLERMSIDHALPKSKHGGNGIQNLIPSCYRCNNRKRDSADVIGNMENFTFLKIAVRYVKTIEIRQRKLADGLRKMMENNDRQPPSIYETLKRTLLKMCRHNNNVFEVRAMCEKALNEISIEEKFDINSIAKAWPDITERVIFEGKGWPDGVQKKVAAK